MSERSEKLLTEGLVAERREMYLHSPTFHHGIQQLVRLLPFVVDAIATRAAEDDEHMAAMLKDMTALPFLGISAETEKDRA